VREARAYLGLDGPVRNWEVQGILDVLRRSVSADETNRTG
jgi:hypothetical protein